MKKLMAALLSATLIFSAAGTVVFHDPVAVEARGYKSGKKGFNFNNNQKQQNTNIQKRDNDATANNKSTATNANKGGGFTSGGLMRGLFFGGLAGLLFGSLLANMGMLGSFLGLMINVLGIIVLFALIKKVLAFFKKKRDEEEANPWRS